MPTTQHEVSSVRQFVIAGSLIGLGLILILAFVRNSDVSGLSDLEFVGMFSGPFVLGLLSLLMNRTENQRRVWLLCTVWSLLAGVVLIFSGVGFFLIALAAGYGWAFMATRRLHSSSIRS